MLSILMTTRDRQAYLDRQVETLTAYIGVAGFEIEVIVFDDGSETPLVINHDSADFSLIRSDKNLGLIEARNQLVSHVSEQSEYLFFLDDDLFVHNLKGFLDDAVQAVDSGYSCAVLPYINLPTFKHEKISTFRHVFDVSKSDDDVVYFFGGASLFLKADFNKAGGLEGLYHMYLEEEDLALRMFTLGMKIKVMYGGRYLALHDQAPGKNTTQRQLYLLSNRMLFHYKFVANVLFRSVLNISYIILYLIKSRSIRLVMDSVDRYKTKRAEINKFNLPTTTLIRFFTKRYFNV